MEMARVLSEAHSLDCKSQRREGELARGVGQLLAAQVGRESSLDLHQSRQIQLVMRADKYTTYQTEERSAGEEKD